MRSYLFLFFNIFLAQTLWAQECNDTVDFVVTNDIDRTACRKTTLIFKNNSKTQSGIFVWSFGDKTANDTTKLLSLTTSHTYNKDGRYSVTLKSIDTTKKIECGSKTKNQFVTIYRPTTDDFEDHKDEFLSYNMTYNVSKDFKPFNEKAWKYEWDFGDNSEPDTGREVSHQYTKENKKPGYTVILRVGLDPGEITLENGKTEECFDTIARKIEVTDGFFTDSADTARPRIPNIFTPNRDGQNETFELVDGNAVADSLIGANDIFYFKTTGEETFKFWVYNRWGNLVYKTEGKTICWQGKTNSGDDAPSGVYYYVVESNASDKRHNTKGFIHLFRE